MIRMYGGPSTRQLTTLTFERLHYFPKLYLDQLKKHPNDPQNIITEIKNNMRKIDLEEVLYA